MLSEEKDQDRRSTERQRDGSHHSFIRHRIPYRLLGRRSLSAKRLVVSSKVLFPAIPTQNCDVVLTFPAETEDATLMWLLARLKSRAPSLTVHVRHHSHTGIYGFYLTALYENLLQGAEELGILKPLKSDYGGGMKEFIYEDQDCFLGVEDESSFLTSQERQSIVLHFLHELRATGDDSLKGITFIEGQPIVPLLITKNVVSQVFPLHNHNDLKVLRQTWIQAIFSTQPLDDVCKYFGVKIALYFAYLGHYTTWLILPAIVGLIIFLLQGDNQFFDDLCYVGFALFNVVWATLYLKFWKRSSTEYCYKWGTLEKKDEMLKDPRPLFKGDLVKSPITGHLELAYPGWKRLLFRYFVTVPIIGVCLSLVFVIMLLCFELQEWVNELIVADELPYLFSFVPKVLLAIVVSILDEIYKEIAVWLTHQENYRLQESHETSLVIKLVMFQLVNSFLSLFYIGFYLRDMDRLRDQLAALLITRQVLGNIKEALLPYVIWKARLYSVGYKIATRMSPASLEKEVRRMTKCPEPKASSSNIEKSSNDSDSESSHITEDEDCLPALTQAEVESAMKKYEDTLDDYLEMCIQFGYITLFSSAFPLAALCALLNNLIEIRSDAFKICLTYQRPFGQRVESIGIWQDVLLVISVLAVIVNCSLIGTSGLLERMVPGFSATLYCLIIVLVEHFILTTKFALYRSVADLPPAMATEMARLEYQRTEALKQLVSQVSQNHGSLISHYPGSPGVRRRKPSENLSPDKNHRESSPPANTLPRPTDFYSVPHATKAPVTSKPEVPPRSSVSKSETDSSQARGSSLHTGVAEKVAAAPLQPMFDDAENSSLTPQPASSSQPTEPKGVSQVLKRAYRNRANLKDIQRRRSEPGTAAVAKALSINKDDAVGGIRRKPIYENKEDLRDERKESKSVREELRSSSEILSGSGEEGRESMLSSSSSYPHIPGILPAMPLSAVPRSFPTSNPRFSATPRLHRGGTLCDPSALASKIISRKSRSFSTADVSEMRPAFRERFSWKGELHVLGKPSSSHTALQDDRTLQDDVADSRKVKDTPQRQDEAAQMSSSKQDCTVSQVDLKGPLSVVDSKPPTASRNKESHKSDETKVSLFKAMRDSVSKPLSLSSRGSEFKVKRP
ncbi:anoctamin-8-like [Physella acuta]|uniref:anoctamin-8-like n=1 Tax=Physella acuta TaxID=109671 RepID=UPI0027DD7560|nr:anoctamin-8-like [Physella acuta]